MIVWLVSFIVIIWSVEVVNIGIDHRLTAFGIVPRDFNGLPKILLAPFLHASLNHVLSNTIPLIVLGGLISIYDRKTLLKVSFIVVLVSGLGIWGIARTGIHVGASSLVFGYFGYLVARGWYHRSFSSVIVAVLVVFFYGGLIYGIFPSSDYISWEGHLFGMLGGGIAAKVIDQRKQRSK